MSEMSTEHTQLDVAVREYLQKRNSDGAYICTGWVLLAAAVTPNDDGLTFLTQTYSDGLAFHSRLGLLANAQHDMLNPGDDDD